MILKNYSVFKQCIYNDAMTYQTRIDSYGAKDMNGATISRLSYHSSTDQTKQNMSLDSGFAYLIGDGTDLNEDDYSMQSIAGLNFSVAKSTMIQGNKYVRTFIITGSNPTSNTQTIRQFGIYKTFYGALNEASSMGNFDALLVKENLENEIVVEPNEDFTFAVTWSEY